MKYTTYSLHNFKDIPQISNFTPDEIFDIEVVGQILPFKTNNYVVDELIDWENYKFDPMYIMNFPQKKMIPKSSFDIMADAILRGENRVELKKIANTIRLQLNPHPAGQVEHNIPELNGELLIGIQHKYKETVLFFPSQGQTCHAYCTFCFRWPQFVGMDEVKFAMKQGLVLVEYLRAHSEVTDLLITGGDPMVMKSEIFKAYIDSIIEADLPNLKTIRIGTKSLSFWPYRFITDNDAIELLETFKKIVDSGYHLALMAHFNHFNELKTPAVKEAVKRIQKTGAIIRTQSPILKGINDEVFIWKTMWESQVKLGMVPYYMFMARNTGAINYFAVTIVNAWKIFREAYSTVSGICRTVRGPSMSADSGKILISGISKINDEKVIALTFLQGRDSLWVRKPFFAKYDENAVWIDDLEPAFGEELFFYKKEFLDMFDDI